MSVVRSEEEIQALTNWCHENEGASHYPGQSYEEGIIATLDWMSGYTDDNPDGEE